MKNVEMTVEGNILIIQVDLSKEFGPSSSGKTIIISSTEGNVSVPSREEVKLGLNGYKKKEGHRELAAIPIPIRLPCAGSMRLALACAKRSGSREVLA